MSTPSYSLSASDIWVEYEERHKLLRLVAPDLGWNIACASSRVINDRERLSALVTTFKAHNPSLHSNIVCSTGVTKMGAGRARFTSKDCSCY